MKQHDTHQHKLYQQFLKELEPGAQEYDRIMARGENPGAKYARKRIILRYAAAACLLLSIPAVAWMLWPTNRPDDVQQLALEVEQKTGQEPASPTPYEVEEKMPEAKENGAARPPRPERPAAPPQQEHQLAHSTSQKTDLPATDAPKDEQKELAELKEQIEAEVQRMLLERQISLEVVNAALKNTEENHQIQCSI